MAKGLRKLARSNKSERGNARVVGLALASGFVLAGVSQANVQVFRRQEVMNLALERGRYEITQKQEAQRGVIYASDGRVLVQNQDVFEFGLFYDRLPKSPGFFAELSAATGISIDDLRRPSLLGEKSRIWSEPISGGKATMVRKLIKDWRADGLSLRRILRRSYPLEEKASGILGLVRDGKALNGLELSMNDVLSGQNGRAKGYIDRTGLFMPVVSEDLTQLVNGQDVTLTIDSELQLAAGMAVRHAVELNKAASGSVVIIEPSTGNILAMANWPSFNPDTNIQPGTDLNVAYRGLFEPGSTFKIMTLAKVLQERKVGYHDHLQCNGRLQVTKSHAVSCSHGAHGDIDWEKAIAESCNVAASTWAKQIGWDHMHSYLNDLGLLKKPEVGLPWETKGMYNENDPAKELQVSINGFGQAMNMTPLALASAYSMLGNGGVRMAPRLIAKIGEKETPVKTESTIVSPEVAEYVRGVMISTIEKDFGTGKGLRIPGYQLAGKTGTAEKKGSRNGGYVSNFVGFVPAEQPKALVLVMIDNPRNGSYYGATVAGPVFVDMAKQVIRRYNIAPDAERMTQVPVTPAAER